MITAWSPSSTFILIHSILAIPPETNHYTVCLAEGNVFPAGRGIKGDKKDKRCSQENERRPGEEPAWNLNADQCQRNSKHTQPTYPHTLHTHRAITLCMHCTHSHTHTYIHATTTHSKLTFIPHSHIASLLTPHVQYMLYTQHQRNTHTIHTLHRLPLHTYICI